jgi:protein-S-isoprenylcysteine O-methyltransferase Ste14
MHVFTLDAHPKLKSASTVWDYVFIVLSIVLGTGSVFLLVFGESLGFTIRFVGWFEIQILLWDTCLSLLFFVQHSGMVRKSFRRQVMKIFPQQYDNAIYAIASGIALALVAVFWQKSETTILVLHGTARTIVAMCNLLGLLLFILGASSLRPFDPLGIGPIRAHLRDKKYQPGPIIIRGPYKWMRHPLYSAVLLMFWANPDVTTDRLLFNVLWTAWICVATLLEERDLTVEFGDPYVQYKKTVPMLIPWRIPRPATSA